MESYTTVGKPATDEFVEKKSRFIGSIQPVSTEDEATAFIAEKKSRHWDASHNCSAYVLRHGGIQRYSDDGEPQGTAGIPILDVLRKEGVFDAVIVVTRYFGGTLLGAGGLVRAYSRGAKLALDAAGRVEMCQCTLLSLPVAYSMYDKVSRLLESYPLQILDTAFLELVTLDIRLRSDCIEKLRLELTELSGATLDPVIIGEEFAAL